MHIDILYAIFLFFIAAAMDAVYASYTYALMKHRAMRAGLLSGLIYLLSAVGIVSFVENKIYVIPLALGAFCGTYFVIERERRQKP